MKCPVLTVLMVGLITACSSSPSFADHFVALSDSPLPELGEATPGKPEIQFAGPATNGGLILAGRQGFYNGWAAHVTDDSKVHWVTSINQKWPAIGLRAVTDAHDGGFWAVGYGQSADTTAAEHVTTGPGSWAKVQAASGYDYLAHLGKSGNVIWQRRLFEGHERYIYCVGEASDGLIVLGYGQLTYRVADDDKKPEIVDVPWITKLDQQGHVKWDLPLVHEELPALATHDITRYSCTGLHVSSNDQITVAFTAVKFEEATKTSGRVVLPLHHWDKTSAPGTTVVQIDRDGHILHSIRTENASNAYLFDEGSGFSLVEHMRYKPDYRKLPARDLIHIYAMDILNVKRSGVRIVRLNEKLQIVSTIETKLSAFSDRVSAVLPAQSGGYFVAGCDENGINSVVRITAAGSLSAIQKIRPSDSANQCDTFGLAHGKSDDEVLVFYGGRMDGNNTTLLKLIPDYVASSLMK